MSASSKKCDGGVGNEVDGHGRSGADVGEEPVTGGGRLARGRWGGGPEAEAEAEARLDLGLEVGLMRRRGGGRVKRRRWAS